MYRNLFNQIFDVAKLKKLSRGSWSINWPKTNSLKVYEPAALRTINYG